MKSFVVNWTVRPLLVYAAFCVGYCAMEHARAQSLTQGVVSSIQLPDYSHKADRVGGVDWADYTIETGDRTAIGQPVKETLLTYQIGFKADGTVVWRKKEGGK